ncbi:MAG TPA: apolipoprotein N-acyltransferase [Actinomycetota bacterium]|nr:apolipoprotein N-acyltransferase [Actinomycetota bacterium]
MPELLPGEASEPAQGQGEDALPGLRLSASDLGLPTQLAVAAGTGIVLSLTLPPLGWWPLVFAAVAVLLWMVRDVRPRRGALLGSVAGATYFGALLYWLLRFGEMGWGALVILSALSLAVFGWIAPTIWRPDRPVVSVLGLAGLWTAIEAGRASWPLGGFSWGQLGTTQVDAPSLPLASIGGVWALSYLVVVVSGLLLLSADRWGRGSGVRAAIPTLIAVAILVLPVAIPLAEPNGVALDVAAIQIDVESVQDLPSEEEDRAVARMNEDLHATLGGDAPDLVVWGEAALDPGASADEATLASVRDTIGSVGAPTIVGAVLAEGADERTSTLAFDGGGSVVDRYDKVHLVPFGEYVPWRSLLEGRIGAIDQIPVDRTPGEEVRPVRVPGLPPLGTPICYENSFPGIQREMVRRGAQVIVLTINNASYGRTAASEQHLVMSRLRAVEDGRWVLHAAISGISAIVDPSGAVVDRRELFEPAVMRARIRASTARTLYVRFGDWVPWTGLALAVAAFALPRRRSRPARAVDPPPPGARTLVILPTYDERDTIRTVLDGVLAIDRPVDVVVIDDGSPDGTAEVVRAFSERDRRVSLIERPGKSGLASAYATGFRRALDRGYDLIVEMDSDLSHRPDELPSLIDAVERADLVVGSRYIPGGSVTDWSRTRLALSKAGNRYARFCLGFGVRDATSGYRIYRADALRAITARPIRSDGYGFQIELVHRAWRAGYVVAESPITFREREHGRSKISRRIVAEALWQVTVWGLSSRIGSGRDPV